ncbi:hypothetical protein KBD71_05240 [Candidatus Woesebacteria bacterium]|nr:hypothetical protein [Candidatus Woesebacteria bacterium]
MDRPTLESPETLPPVDTLDQHQERILYEWVAASRPYKKRDREFYTTIGVIVFLLSLILFFAGQFLFIAVVISAAFVAYVLNTIPPEDVHNAITTFGIRSGQQLFYWEELGRFWFTQKYKTSMLHVETARAFPGVLVLLLTDATQEEVLKKVLVKYTVFEKPKDTWVDKASLWLQEKFPLEKDDLSSK